MEFLNPRAGPRIAGHSERVIRLSSRKVEVTIALEAEPSYNGDLIVELGSPDLMSIASAMLFAKSTKET